MDEEKRLDQLKGQIKAGHFTLTEVIDVVVEINGIIGVGLISLGDDLKDYCYNHTKIKKEERQKENV